MRRFVIATAVLLVVLLAYPASAIQPVTRIDANPIGFYQPTGILDVEKGKYIRVVVSIGVHCESPASLDGFWLKMIFTKPSGRTVTKWFDYSTTYIPKCTFGKQFTIDTGVLADEVGTWKLVVELWTKDKSARINYDSTTFNVKQALPAAYINIQSVVGYVMVAAIGAAVGYLLRSARV